MFKHKFRIGVDMDDTIEDLLDSWITYLNKTYDKNVKICDLKSRHLEKYYPDLTHDEIYDCLKTHEFWKSVKPKLDAIYYLDKLIKEDHQKIYLVTASRYDHIQAKVEEVLLKYFPMINIHNIISVYDKSMVNVDILIDDSFDQLKKGSYKKILIDSPTNMGDNIKNTDVIRAKNWEEIYNILYVIDKVLDR